MSVENQVLSTVTTPFDGFWLVVKVGLIFLIVLYFIFSLIMLRQINLMTETVTTGGSGFWRFFAILHAGLALGIIILFIGFFFG